jgi:hypothetical protein
MSGITVDNYIAGSHCPPSSGEYVDVVNPANFQVEGRVGISNIKDVHDAVHAAEAAFPAWSRRTIKARAAMVRYGCCVNSSAVIVARVRRTAWVPPKSYHPPTYNSSCCIYIDDAVPYFDSRAFPRACGVDC